MVIHVGYLRAGWRGLVVAGMLFILPAATIVLALSWAYVQFGSTPSGESLLYGIKPVVIAVVAQALWGLGRTALKGPLLITVGILAASCYFVGLNELVILFGRASRPHRPDHTAPVARADRSRGRRTVGGLPLSLLMLQLEPVPVSLTTLFLTFLKIGQSLWQRLCPARLSAQRLRRASRLAERPAIARCGGNRPDDSRTGLHDRDVCRLSRRRCAWGGSGHRRHLLAGIRLRRPAPSCCAAPSPESLDGGDARWRQRCRHGVDGGGDLAPGPDAIVDPLTATITIAAALLLIRFRVNSAWLILAGAIVGLAVNQLR